MKANKVNEIMYTFHKVSNTDYFENPKICCDVHNVVDVVDYECGIHKSVYVNVVD